MSEFNIEEFAKSLEQVTTPKDVDRLFAAVPAAARKTAADAAQRDLLTEGLEVEGIADRIRQIGIAASREEIKQEIETSAAEFEVADVIADAQVVNQILSNAEEILGKEASPFLKAFAAAARKLTDEEYNSLACVIKPTCAVLDAIAESKGLLKQNPLRRGDDRAPRP